MSAQVFQCLDGTAFPVDWRQEGAETHTWRWNQEHVPVPLKPLLMDFEPLGDEGRRRAFSDSGMAVFSAFEACETPNGFEFRRMSPPPPAEMFAIFEQNVRAAAERGGIRMMWLEFSKPRMVAGCEALRAAPTSMPMAELAELWQETFWHSMTAGPSSMIPLTVQLQMLLGPVIGPDAAAVAAQDLWGGEDNPTLQASREIWEMAQLAASRPEVRELVGRGDAGAVADTEALAPDDQFRLAFAAYVEKYRWRTDQWHAGSRSLGEQPETVLRLIESAMRQQRTPDDIQREGAERSAELRARIEASLEDKPEMLGRFRELVQSLDGYVLVREDRALWQLTVHGSLRDALLRRGRILADAGVIAEPEDVLFLRAVEVDGALANPEGAGDFSERIEARRREWEYWCEHQPPIEIGAPMPPGAQLLLGLPARRPEDPVTLLRGIAGSSGQVTARARVVRSLDESDAFEPGEVLVCVMTSPPWTPLFALASGIVTDAGTVMSHPAIIAREFGIPGVVGCAEGTRRIPDGSLITVDGDAGTVTVHGE